MGALLLTACAVGPDYERPSLETPTTFKESRDWKKAQPRDAIDRGAWWSVYNDPILDGLEKQIDVSNQTLKAAEAAARAAKAATEETRAGLFPSLNLETSTTRFRGSSAPTSAGTAYNLGADVAWTPDVWGRIRRAVESDDANAEASAADLAAVRLSMQTMLAGAYFDLRVQDELVRLLQATVAANKNILDLARGQYAAGLSTQADVLAAHTQLESTKAQRINAGVKRAQLEHAIAVLIGKPPSVFLLAPTPFKPRIPVVPSEVPSALLERRPDIAAAERTVMAANAGIGVAEAAWFPSVTLSASSGFTGSALGTLLQASQGWWGIGATVTETILDGGAREAGVERAKAEHDKAVATYRQTVLTAFREVEDHLVAQRLLDEQTKSQNAAVAMARAAEALTLKNYAQGLAPYNNVLTAQVTTLMNAQNTLALTGARLATSVALIGALGGGWDATELGAKKATENHQN